LAYFRTGIKSGIGAGIRNWNRRVDTMGYVLFILNFLINWFLIFIVVAFGLQYLHASWATIAIVTTAVLIGSILFFLTSHVPGR
jgi:hypothetical protein